MPSLNKITIRIEKANKGYFLIVKVEGKFPNEYTFALQSEEEVQKTIAQHLPDWMRE